MRRNLTLIEGLWLVLLHNTINHPTWYWVLITVLIFPRWSYIKDEIITQLDYQKTKEKDSFSWWQKRRQRFILVDTVSEMYVIQSDNLTYSLTQYRDKATKFKYSGVNMAKTIASGIFKTRIEIF